MMKKIIISSVAAFSLLAFSLPASANTPVDYRQSGIQMMSQYALENPESQYQFSRMMNGRYNMMSSWGAGNLGYGLMHLAFGLFCLIWIANSILIGYLLVVLIQKFSRKK